MRLNVEANTSVPQRTLEATAVQQSGRSRIWRAPRPRLPTRLPKHLKLAFASKLRYPRIAFRSARTPRSDDRSASCSTISSDESYRSAESTASRPLPGGLQKPLNRQLTRMKTNMGEMSKSAKKMSKSAKRKTKRAIYWAHRKTEKHLIRIRILISLVQVTSQLGLVFSIPYPPFYNRMVSYLGVFSLDFLSVCLHSLNKTCMPASESCSDAVARGWVRR